MAIKMRLAVKQGLLLIVHSNEADVAVSKESQEGDEREVQGSWRLCSWTAGVNSLTFRPESHHILPAPIASNLTQFHLLLQVTHSLKLQQPPLVDSLFEFYATFVREDDVMAAARMHMYVTYGKKEFPCFFAFINSFLSRLVDKSFTVQQEFT